MKNKSKFIAIFVVIALCFMTSFVFAEDNLGVMPISVDSGNEVTDDSTTPDSQNTVDGESLDNSNTSVEGTNSENDVLDDVSSDEQPEQVEENQNNDSSYVDHDVYLTGNTVNIDYFVDGNVFIFANDVTISSQISGDVFVCARNLTIEKTAFISGNVFSVTDSFVFRGIAYDMYSLSTNITFDNAYAYRDIKVISNDFKFYGTVGRNAFISASSISFNSDNGEETGLIYGDFNYSSNKEIQIPDGSVSGSVNYNPTEISSSVDVSSYFISLGSFMVLAIVIWLLSLWLKPKFVNNNSSTKNNALWIVICGILGVILIPLVSILLLFIPIVSRISLLLLSLFFVALSIGESVFTVGVNNFICRKLKVSNNIGKLGVLIITSLVVWLLFLIPYNIGFILSLIAMILGFGILINSIIPRKSKNLNGNDEKSSMNIVEENSKKEKKNSTNTKANEKDSNNKDSKDGKNS